MRATMSAANSISTTPAIRSINSPSRSISAISRYTKAPTRPELPEDSYHGEDIAVRAREFADVYGDKYISESEEVRRKALVDFALPKNIDSMHEILSKYRIEYDTWFKESTLHNGTELRDTIELLKEKGLTYELDGALWYKNIEVQTKRLLAQGKTQEEIDKLGLKDDVLIRQNGNPTYFAADIAYHRNKLAVRKFDRAIDVWGADHHGHVARMKGALDAIGLDGDKLDIILMQLVRLTRNGEVVRMSKRTGKAITLGRPARRDTDRRGAFLLQSPRARNADGVRPRSRCCREFAEPGLLLPVRPRENLQHSEKAQGAGL